MKILTNILSSLIIEQLNRFLGSFNILVSNLKTFIKMARKLWTQYAFWEIIYYENLETIILTVIFNLWQAPIPIKVKRLCSNFSRLLYNASINVRRSYWNYEKDFWKIVKSVLHVFIKIWIIEEFRKTNNLLEFEF